MKIFLSDKEFLELKKIIYKESGIDVQENERGNLEFKLSARVKESGLASFREYVELLMKNSIELQAMINTVTTNETYFFREQRHFDFLQQEIIPRIKYEKFRVWSAAGSNGAEAYSIAMLLKSKLSAYKNFEVLASDINNNVLEFAKNGIYPLKFAKKIPHNFLKLFCARGKNSMSGYFKISSQLKENLQFKQINLMQPIGEDIGKFDLIFLRNMIIYFEDKNKKYIVENVLKHLKEDGYLFMGHSESLHRITDKVIQISPSIYQKKAATTMTHYEPKKYLSKTSSRVIAIGSSMGGLSVIKDTIMQLKPNIPPVLIVQHLSRDTLSALLPKLAQDAAVNLKIAQDNELIEQGTLYFAPYNKHLKIKYLSKGMYKTILYDGDKITNHKPSIDILFNSFATDVKNHASAFLLSGMGNDGVEGITNIKKANGRTYAQDEQSSDVFGMGNVAIEQGVIDHIISADELANTINSI